MHYNRYDNYLQNAAQAILKSQQDNSRRKIILVLGKQTARLSYYTNLKTIAITLSDFQRNNNEMVLKSIVDTYGKSFDDLYIGISVNVSQSSNWLEKAFWPAGMTKLFDSFSNNRRKDKFIVLHYSPPLPPQIPETAWEKKIDNGDFSQCITDEECKRKYLDTKEKCFLDTAQDLSKIPRGWTVNFHHSLQKVTTKIKLRFESSFFPDDRRVAGCLTTRKPVALYNDQELPQMFNFLKFTSYCDKEQPLTVECYIYSKDHKFKYSKRLAVIFTRPGVKEHWIIPVKLSPEDAFWRLVFVLSSGTYYLGNVQITSWKVKNEEIYE